MLVSYGVKGCVRLTLFRNRNTYNDGKKSLIKGFRSYWSTRRLLNSHVSATVCRIGLSNFLKENFNSYSAYSYYGIRSIERNLRCKVQVNGVGKLV